MTAARDPHVDLELTAGTLRATLVHGAVQFAWRRAGARAWATDRKSLEEAQTFVGTLADLMRNDLIAQRQRETV